MVIHELIEILRQYDQMAEVVCTWEGQTQPIQVYQAANGRVMIDGDNGFYKIRWQELNCSVCGDPAVHAPFEDKPVCYLHWETYKNEENGQQGS